MEGRRGHDDTGWDGELALEERVEQVGLGAGDDRVRVEALGRDRIELSDSE